MTYPHYEGCPEETDGEGRAWPASEAGETRVATTPCDDGETSPSTELIATT